MQPIVDTAKSEAADVTINFQAIDYALFTFLLLVSIGIGVYFGYFNNTAQTTEEYLMGGRKMKTLPIAISLVAR